MTKSRSNSPDQLLQSLEKNLTFGFEETFTINEWWASPGFTSTSQTDDKWILMKKLATSLEQIQGGKTVESIDIWGHPQLETIKNDGTPSFVITMDPGSIEVKTPPVTISNMDSMAECLLKSAQLSDLLTYRSWWYGVQGGTEGGCHVNMGGHDLSTNIFYQYPYLILQYFSYLHNRPWLTYPFQSLDVGPLGNSMRMDEKEDFEKVKSIFSKLKKTLSSSEKKQKFTVQDILKAFEGTSLIEEKNSAPSLAKFKAPHYLIEDRAQESLRSPEEFKLVSNLRIEILKLLLKSEVIEDLDTFPLLHKEQLTSFYLWGKFQTWANSIEINPVYYQRFFDRQFPRLQYGVNQPKRFFINEGRRPRHILSSTEKNGVIVSRTIDTRFKRLELFYTTLYEEQLEFVLDASGIEYQSPLLRHEGFLGFGEEGRSYYQYIDLKMETQFPFLKIILRDKLTKDFIEKAEFNLNDMMWK